MGEYKDLTSAEARLKLKELAEDINICMFCTELAQLPIAARPMSLQKVDDSGNLWFISSARSNKNFDILRDNNVQLFFSEKHESKFLSIFGEAMIYKDRSKIEDVWSPIAKAWFEEGKDDPDVSVIKVVPKDAYYWDTQNGKTIALLKWATAAVVGKRMDDGGVEGNLNI